MIDRKNPPRSGELADFLFPSYEREELKNKVKLYSVNNPSQTMTGIKLIIKNGAFSENVPGTAFCAGQMLTRGSKEKSAQEIALTAESLGTNVQVHAGWDALSISALALEENFDKILDLVLECMNESVFDQDELDNLRHKHLAHIQQEMVDANFLARFAFAMEYYRGHFYGHPLIGSTKSISNIKTEDLSRWYEESKKNEVGAIVFGKYDEKIVRDKLETSLSDWQYKNNTKFEYFKNKESKRKVVLIDKPDASQTTICIGREIVGRDDPDFVKLQFANVMFGGYFLSRLNEVIREEMGLTYGIYSQLDIRRMGNTLNIVSGINKSLTKKTFEAIKEEILKFASDEITHEEFDRAKQYVMGSFLRSIETQNQVSGMLSNIFVNDLSSNYYADYFNLIKSLNIEDMTEVRKRFFDPKEFIIAAAGDIDFLSNELAEYGEIKIAEKL